MKKNKTYAISNIANAQVYEAAELSDQILRTLIYFESITSFNIRKSLTESQGWVDWSM